MTRRSRPDSNWDQFGSGIASVVAKRLRACVGMNHAVSILTIVGVGVDASVTALVSPGAALL